MAAPSVGLLGDAMAGDALAETEPDMLSPRGSRKRCTSKGVRPTLIPPITLTRRATTATTTHRN